METTEQGGGAVPGTAAPEGGNGGWGGAASTGPANAVGGHRIDVARKDGIVLRGVRPVALAAVSERERLRACPHRVKAALNHARALAMGISAQRPENAGRAEGSGGTLPAASPGPEADTSDDGREVGDRGTKGRKTPRGGGVTAKAINRPARG